MMLSNLKYSFYLRELLARPLLMIIFFIQNFAIKFQKSIIFIFQLNKYARNKFLSR